MVRGILFLVGTLFGRLFYLLYYNLFGGGGIFVGRFLKMHFGCFRCRFWFLLGFLVFLYLVVCFFYGGLGGAGLGGCFEFFLFVVLGLFFFFGGGLAGR